MCMSAISCRESVEIPDERDNEEMCHVFGPTDKEVENEKFPMRPGLISREQKKDPVVSRQLEDNDKEVHVDTIEDAELVCLNGRIIVPHSLRQRVIEWYHTYLAHPGIRCMTDMVSKLYFWPKMEQEIKKHIKTCRQCQLNKNGKRSASRQEKRKSQNHGSESM